ncbi:TPA: type VI secretion system membrane subunit TssM [Pseudomonas putida]|uniref:Type VI secretion protein IcmF n=2 Tax=Pseudomonas putida TaxID=303 RepID=B0KHN1_PSEPG|nr:MULTISPECIES: type VI secretion system membrane subunit TssM [Pseudomonas]ABY99113.1 type VI secretion protein IcmF [Pseudomonas putida GB-1]APE99340.1 type VI secretion protein VasK [Pseudomonas putida]MBP0708679.1 type VI secretion system membrane subunit TssM [Pseudomonas sp. T34]MCE1000275.1 type VI secretion system membrane subunit TssM [Pseudomonas sp. NMI1173_11]MCK2188117.1 type VI secretion system membrane subunit TssM [Pseudomonas sp. MB04B]
MNQIWNPFKRWGLQWVTRAGLALPLLLGLGTALMLVAIWWLGPQWSWYEQKPLASVLHRSLASLVFLLMLLLGCLVVLRIRYRRLQAERREVVAAEQDRALHFVQAQEMALSQGLDRYLDNAGGRRALYRLPWYLVLGDEQSGKTSFVDRSDQRFTLTRIDQAQARGRQAEALAYPVGWWVSDDAVIIDPPGIFISQNPPAGSAATDPSAPPGTQARLWEHLLGWLLRNRSRRALNGLLLVVDLPALLHGKPEQRAALAHGLRTRLYEVSSQLGSRLPLYVVLTKFDLLDGFDQLYSKLSAAKRESLLGFTFKLDAVDTFDAWLEEYDQQYGRLLAKLNEQVFDRLDVLGKTAPRGQLFSLHAQLIGLRPILLTFLRETLASDRFTTPALVRGVYWSSVVQQGDIRNVFVREAAQPYKTKLPLLEGKAQGKALAYFIQQAFRRVIYQEAGLAGDNIRVTRSKRQLLWVGSGVGILAFSVAIGSWQRYFDINSSKATSVLAKSQEYSQREVDQRLDPTGRNLLEPLDRIRDAVAVFGDYRTAWPGVADFGLYEGRNIGPLVDEAYLSLLSKRFLPALAGGVIDVMNAATPGSERQMAALRVYRMIEERHSRRPEWVEDWMARQWQQAFPGQGQLQRDLMQHLKYALAYADADLPQYRQRVNEVQQALRELPLPLRVYTGLKQQAHEQLHTSLDLRHQVGPAFDVVYQTSSGAQGEDVTLAPMLTAKGFREYFAPRSERFAEMAMVDQWALGERSQLDYSDIDRHALTERLHNLYSADYIDSWRRALNAFTVADFRDLDHGVTILEQLTGPAAPLQRLLETVRDNTSLASPAVVETPSEVTKLRPPTAKPDQQQTLAIPRAFAGLGAMLQATGEKPTYYDETLGAIAAVLNYAKAVQDSPDRGKAALQAVHQRFSMTGQDPIGTLQRIATGLPEPINHQVRKLADQTAQVLNVEALRELERRWDAEVYSFFQQRLANRYPFVVRAPDAALDDFEAFFGPKGRLQQFNERYLKVFLKENLEALYSSQYGQSLIREDVIEQLELADRIRETFFDQRGKLSVQFSIEPLGLSANQRTSLLDLDGQLISYTHGPRQITGIVWPNTLGQQVRSNLTLLRQSGNSSSLEYRGPWSMFRLLSRGSLNGRTATSVDLSFRTGDGVMRYRLNAEKAFNPITQQPFKGFRLPRGLLQQPLKVAQME